MERLNSNSLPPLHLQGGPALNSSFSSVSSLQGSASRLESESRARYQSSSDSPQVRPFTTFSAASQYESNGSTHPAPEPIHLIYYDHETSKLYAC